MKKCLCVMAALVLSGCAELDTSKPDEWSQWPQEDTSDSYYHSPEEWKVAGFTYHDARQWHDLGYSPNDANMFRQNGATTAEEVSIVGQIMDNSPTPTSALASDYKYIFTEIAQNKVSLSDLRTAKSENSGIQRNEILKIAEKIHQGQSAELVYSDMRKKEEQERYQEGINTYGQGIIARCHGVPVTVPIMLAFQDPYLTENKCYVANIAARWGQPQWISTNTVLIVDTMPNVNQTFATFVTDPSGHLHYGAAAVMMGGIPTTYTSITGSQIVAPSLSVIKYLP
ncbi:hypothetical protein HKD21_10460 [Gluconobacter cerevisiae]|uniref:Uncharacterized protein n=1 Tax=Gluconobacter cerevisiae TaxID=1379734 RepID=A0ABR9YFH6_9PROT|nr:hypothetical protein [Gluconobacter cerevisiae]MBF0877267.1 hypothetical protein [Gluconobacter cerevisiae]